MNIKHLFLEAVKSRSFVALWILALLQTVLLVVLVAVYVRSGLTVQTHCDLGSGVPDCTSTEAPWFYLFNFAAFAVAALAANVVASLKLLEAKGRTLALSWLGLTALVMIVATALLSAILRIVEL